VGQEEVEEVEEVVEGPGEEVLKRKRHVYILQRAHAAVFRPVFRCGDGDVFIAPLFPPWQILRWVFNDVMDILCVWNSLLSKKENWRDHNGQNGKKLF